MSLYPGFADAVNFLYPGAMGRDVILQDDGAGPYLKAWNLPGNPPTDAEVDAALAQIPAAQIAADKVLAKTILDNHSPISRVERNLIALIVSELNLLRAWITSFKAATAAATSLANLQTRVAALDAMPARTGPVVTQAIKDAIDAET